MPKNDEQALPRPVSLTLDEAGTVAAGAINSYLGVLNLQPIWWRFGQPVQLPQLGGIVAGGYRAG